jgi:hypothetical protein
VFYGGGYRRIGGAERTPKKNEGKSMRNEKGNDENEARR